MSETVKTSGRYTVFQQLESLFGPERKKEEAKSRYSLGDEQILKTQSKEEYDLKKLELQQAKYLSNMWHRVDNEIYQQSVFYETTRIASHQSRSFGSEEIENSLNLKESQ